MFHTYFNPIKKSFEFCYAFLTKVSVGDTISLLQFDWVDASKYNRIIFFHANLTNLTKHTC